MKLTKVVNLMGEDIMDLDFGKVFRDNRKIKGLTLEALAARIQVTKSYLSQVENGQRKLSEDQARKTAEILGIEDIETWVFLATKAPLIQTIQRQFPAQFNSLFRERKSKSNIYRKIVKASVDSKSI